MNEIILKISMRIMSSEVLIIMGIILLSWGTEYRQLGIGALAGFLTKEAVDTVKSKNPA